MSFVTRDFLTILSGMVGRLIATQSQLTDFNIGSVTRSLLESPAAELEALYVQYVNGLLDAIPSAVYLGFDFTRLPATHAGGVVTFYGVEGRTEPVLIPSGTRISVPNTTKTYETLDDATLAVDYEIALARVVALTAGASGNALPASLTLLGTAIEGIGAVSNLDAMTSGRDQETDAERLERFLRYLDSLSRGTPAALEYAAKAARIPDADSAILEFVTRVGLDEHAPGRVRMWLYGSAGPVSTPLLREVRRLLDGYQDASLGRVAGYRAAGVQVELQRMISLPVDIELEIQPRAGRVLDDALRADLLVAASEYLGAVPSGGTIQTSLLIAQLLRVDGVLSLDLLAPSANIAVPLDSVPTLGEATIT